MPQDKTQRLRLARWRNESKDTAAQDRTLLVETSIFVCAIYLYLALGMYYASYFLFLLDSPIEDEARFVHALAWLWRSGIPFLCLAFIMDRNNCKKREDRSRGYFWLFGAFPLWLASVLVLTLLMDALDEILFK